MTLVSKDFGPVPVHLTAGMIHPVHHHPPPSVKTIYIGVGDIIEVNSNLSEQIRNSTL